MTLRTLYTITKPGIVYGNTFIATAGYIVGAHGHYVAQTFIAMLIGLACIIASGCVYNNYIDRGIDSKMKRTKKRALVRGDISGPAALLYATLLGCAGAALLAWYTNVLTLAIALAGLFFYVVAYGIGKRATVHGTVIGSISGAIPPVVGYCAATGTLDSAAFILFSILVCWQMPHFYAIAMFRKDDYAAAGLPVLPVVYGMYVAKKYILAYIMLFIGAVGALAFFGYAGSIYLAIMGGIGVYWAWQGIMGLDRLDDVRWARRMFHISLVALPALPVALLLDTFLLS